MDISLFSVAVLKHIGVFNQDWSVAGRGIFTTTEFDELKNIFEGVDSRSRLLGET